jgi:hypothetical protein
MRLRAPRSFVFPFLILLSWYVSTPSQNKRKSGGKGDNGGKGDSGGKGEGKGGAGGKGENNTSLDTSQANPKGEKPVTVTLRRKASMSDPSGTTPNAAETTAGAVKLTHPPPTKKPRASATVESGGNSSGNSANESAPVGPKAAAVPSPEVPQAANPSVVPEKAAKAGSQGAATAAASRPARTSPKAAPLASKAPTPKAQETTSKVASPAAGAAANSVAPPTSATAKTGGKAVAAKEPGESIRDLLGF